MHKRLGKAAGELAAPLIQDENILNAVLEQTISYCLMENRLSIQECGSMKWRFVVMYRQ